MAAALLTTPLFAALAAALTTLTAALAAALLTAALATALATALTAALTAPLLTALTAALLSASAFLAILSLLLSGPVLPPGASGALSARGAFTVALTGISLLGHQLTVSLQRRIFAQWRSVGCDFHYAGHLTRKCQGRL